jgi:hypothetical protein
MKQIAVIIALAALGMAGSKERDWQGGRLLDSERNHYFEPTGHQAGTNDSEKNEGFDNQNQGSAFGSGIVDTYVVETDECVYLVSRTRLKITKAPALLRYRPVKFAVEKKKLWLIDADGKEVETKIVKTLQKKPADGTQVTAQVPQP